MQYTKDSLQSLANSLGYKDSPFAGVLPNVGVAGDWLAKAAVYRVPEDCFKKGYNWVGSEQQIAAMEAEELKHDIHTKKRDALALSRLDGEAYLYFDDGTSPTKEINLDRITKGKLRFVNLLRRDQVSMGELETDPLSRYFGHPSYYQVSGRTSGVVRIHPSRIARFRHFPDQMSGVGRSVLLTVGSVIAAANDARNNVVCLTEQARVWVMSANGLFDAVTDPHEESLVQKRYQIFQQMLKTNALAVIDKDKEELSQQSTHFSTLPDIIESMRREVAAALEIPYSLLFGRQGGLGNNGDMEMREYYDSVSVVQRNDIDAPCRILDQVIIRSALGNDGGGEVFKEWRSLWEMSDKERADIAKAFAEAARTAVDSGIMTADMLTEPLANQWIEGGVFAGLEQSMEGARERIRAEAEELEEAGDLPSRSPTADEVTDSILDVAREILKQ